jgi:hypothetical protein
VIGPTPGAVVSRRTGSLAFASRLTLRSSSTIWHPTASRAPRSDSTTAASSGRPSSKSPARSLKADAGPKFFRSNWTRQRPRTRPRPGFEPGVGWRSRNEFGADFVRCQGYVGHHQSQVESAPALALSPVVDARCQFSQPLLRTFRARSAMGPLCPSVCLRVACDDYACSGRNRAARRTG